MADTYIQLPADSTGKKTRTYNQTIGSDDVHSQVTLIGNTTLSGLHDAVSHDFPDTGASLKLGARAIALLSGITAVSAADRTDLYADLDGRLVVSPYTTAGCAVYERVSDTAGNSTASSVFTGVAGLRNCITTIAVYNANTTTAGYVDIRDGTGGPIMITLPLPAGGGAVVNFPVPLTTTTGTALAYDVNTAITTVYLSFIGFRTKA